MQSLKIRRDNEVTKYAIHRLGNPDVAVSKDIDGLSQQLVGNADGSERGNPPGVYLVQNSQPEVVRPSIPEWLRFPPSREGRLRQGRHHKDPEQRHHQSQVVVVSRNSCTGMFRG